VRDIGKELKFLSRRLLYITICLGQFFFLLLQIHVVMIDRTNHLKDLVFALIKGWLCWHVFHISQKLCHFCEWITVRVHFQKWHQIIYCLELRECISYLERYRFVMRSMSARGPVMLRNFILTIISLFLLYKLMSHVQEVRSEHIRAQL